ncbi:MAG: hypothetical protein H6633_11650 [Anaerolineales bacterium]|nr:hypothetical protein [Anaerolineales bacterium]
MDILNRLFPQDEDARFELAQTRAAQVDWHLSRAIPDLEAAIRLAHSALLDGDLSYEAGDQIAARLKKSRFNAIDCSKNRPILLIGSRPSRL